MATIFLNGKFCDESDAMVSALDAGLQHGVGLFETFLAVRDEHAPHGVRAIFLHEHLTRLAHAGRELGMVESLRRDALAEAVERTCARAFEKSPKTRTLRVRLTMTPGSMNLLAGAGPSTSDGSSGGGAALRPSSDPTLMVVAQPATHYPSEMFERGVPVTIADLRVNPLDPTEGHKTLHYWPRLRELQRAAKLGAGEALVFQVTNHLAGGCVSNCFVVKRGRLITPIAKGEERGTHPHDDLPADDRPHMGPNMGPTMDDDAGKSEGGGTRSASPAPKTGVVMPSPVLAGITRAWILSWADQELIDTEVRGVTIDDVLSADEVFLTNSSWGVLPVVRVERERVGGGSVGDMSRQLRAAWLRVLLGDSSASV